MHSAARLPDFAHSDWAQLTMVAISTLTAVGTYVSMVLLWVKRRKARKAQTDRLDDHLIHVGSAEDLERAEQELRVRDDAGELDSLLQTHVLIDRLSTNHGVSQAYVDDLVAEFDKNGLHLRAILRQTVPLGAIGVIERPGIYELFVPFEEKQAAEQLLIRRSEQS